MPSGSEFIRQIKDQVQEIDPAEVHELTHEGVAIVDVRETEETESGLLPGAKHVPATKRAVPEPTANSLGNGVSSCT